MIVDAGWHAPAEQASPTVHAFASSHAVPVALGEQVPTSPGRLHALHWPLQALSQQTPLAQKPDVHWLPDVQPSAKEGS